MPLRVTSDPAALYRVFLGRVSLAAAMDDGGVRVDGPPPPWSEPLPRWSA
jgi:hypothetical protein